MDNIKKLETKFFQRDQLTKVSTKDNKEKLVDISKIDPTIILVPRIDNVAKTGKTIFVRQTVAKKLKKINQGLNKKGLYLKIVDGYRLPEVQKEYWEYQISLTKKKHPKWTLEMLETEAMKFCAMPSLSFHPTGGAVDLTLVNSKNGKDLAMGTKINNFSHRAYSHYTLLSATALKNRKILFQVMEKEGFYNYPAEWWHFSYGTTDWSLFYKKPHAIYNVIKFKK